MTELDKRTMEKEDKPAARLFCGVGLPGLVLCNFSGVVVAALGTVIEKELRISHTLLGVIQSGLFCSPSHPLFQAGVEGQAWKAQKNGRDYQ